MLLRTRQGDLRVLGVGPWQLFLYSPLISVTGESISWLHLSCPRHHTQGSVLGINLSFPPPQGWRAVFLAARGCLRAGPPGRDPQTLPSLICGPASAGAGSGHLYEMQGPPLRAVMSWCELQLGCLACLSGTHPRGSQSQGWAGFSLTQGRGRKVLAFCACPGNLIFGFLEFPQAASLCKPGSGWG